MSIFLLFFLVCILILFIWFGYRRTALYLFGFILLLAVITFLSLLDTPINLNL